MKDSWNKYRPVVIDVVKSAPGNRYQGGNNNAKNNFDIISLPIFSISNVPWLGSSFIVTTFPAKLSQNCSLILPMPVITNPSFCLAFSIPTGARYKLWQNVGEILHYPMYLGENIPGGVLTFEAWSVFGHTKVELNTPYIISLSTQTPDTNCSCSCVKNPYSNQVLEYCKIFTPKDKPFTNPYFFNTCLNDIL
jgi:hypothetical protein